MEWISINERLPPEDEWVLVCGGKRYSSFMVARWTRSDEWLIESCSDIINIYPPTHWTPLPDPPKE